MTMLIVLLSCGANPTKLMSKALDKVYVGMPIQEFKDEIDKEELVVMKEDVTVYKLVYKTYNDAHVMLSGSGWRSDFRYFYFVDGKLAQIDKGEKAVDYRIKIN